MNKTLRAFALSTGLGLAALSAFASELPYDKAAFDAALAQHKPVIVDFSATWCPTCKQQKPIVQSLMQDKKRESVTLFLADYDTESSLKKQLGVAQQSTFVVFKGGKEVARSTGQTDKRAIAELFDKAL